MMHTWKIDYISGAVMQRHTLTVETDGGFEAALRLSHVPWWMVVKVERIEAPLPEPGDVGDVESESCGTCKAFMATRYECRRHSPVWIPAEGASGWPEVTSEGWCLEHVRK